MRLAAILAATLMSTSAAQAQIAPPERQAPAGVIDVATSAELKPIVERLGQAFAARKTGVSVRVKPMGSNVAMASLYAGQVDLSIIGRRIADQEAKGFEWIYLKPPIGVEVFRGSAYSPGHSPTITLIVSKKSSLRSITMQELAARFHPGAKGRIYMPDAESGTGRFFREKVLGGANQLDWMRVFEISETDHRNPGQVNDDIAKKVARDPQSLGISDASPRPGVRAVPIVDAGNSLERAVYAYPHPAKRNEAEQFLLFLRSPEAQSLISASPYRPL